MSLLSHQRTSLTVYGASGFTGIRVAEEVARQSAIFTRIDAGFQWAIAGRRKSVLDSILASLQAKFPDARLPSIVVASNDEPEQLKAMAKNTRLVLNCVGPYALLGEPVVRAVLEASEELVKEQQSATHYADLTGEPGFAEKMVLEYHDAAHRVGSCIIHYAAFDSVPSDIGVLFAKRELERAGAVPSSIEMFFALHTGRAGYSFHYGTYASAVNGFAKKKLLSDTRKRLFGPTLPRPKPLAVESGLATGLPKRKGKLGGLLNWADDMRSYLIPFFFADPSVVRLSQSLTAARPAASRASYDVPTANAFWVQIPSAMILFLAAAALPVFGLLTTFRLGRSILKRFPRFFSAGLCSHEGPSREQLEQTSFTTTLKAKGHSQALIKSGAKGVKPDVELTVKVRGPEPGYVATPIFFVAVAATMLRHEQKIQKGVLTPAAALGLDTGIVELLHEGGKVKFERVQ